MPRHQADRTSRPIPGKHDADDGDRQLADFALKPGAITTSSHGVRRTPSRTRIAIVEREQRRDDSGHPPRGLFVILRRAAARRPE